MENAIILENTQEIFSQTQTYFLFQICILLLWLDSLHCSSCSVQLTIFWWPGTVTCSLLSSQSITFCPQYHVVSYEKVSQAISVEHVTYKYIKYKWIMDHNNESHSVDGRLQCQQTWIIIHYMIWKLLFLTFDMFYWSFLMTVEVFHHHKAAV